MHLTKSVKKPELEPDRAAIEIEITDEMIEAGVSVICSQDGIAPLGFFFSPSELAEQVYAAMETCRQARGR